jgi:prevent-host-death family protein
MTEATLKELRRATGRIVRAVERGERILVTHRGRPVARMVPLDSPATTDEPGLFGIWRDHPASKSVEAYIDRIRKGRFA